jgi:hypothetical protein
MKTVLICFSTRSERFKDNYDRNKFFRGLYGWKQIINTQNKKYTYDRHGLLDEIPHIRVDQSMFVIMREHMRMMEEFFDEWEGKIRWQSFNVLLDEEQKKLLRRDIDG